MKSHVTAIIESFEAETIAEAEALAKLQEATGRVVDAGWLQHYWRSESLESLGVRQNSSYSVFRLVFWDAYA